MDFIEVAKIGDIPDGDRKVVNVNGKEIALFNYEGKFYAIDNKCAHKGGPLGEGKLENDIVSCPWHAWKFNIKTGTSPVNPDVKVSVYEVQIEGEKINVSTEPKS